MRVLASAPHTSTFLCAPLSTIFTPACSAYTNPEQPPETSNPHAPLAPILSCTRHAVEGNIMSGVTVPTMMHSTSLGLNAARRQALLRRLRADVAHAQPLGQHVPLLDPSALHNPLVVGIHHFFEVLIGQNLRRNVGSERRNLRAPAHHRTNGKAQCISPCGAPHSKEPGRTQQSTTASTSISGITQWPVSRPRRLNTRNLRAPTSTSPSVAIGPLNSRATTKKYRVTYCTRTSPLPLLPSGPGGIGGITSRRTRH